MPNNEAERRNCPRCECKNAVTALGYCIACRKFTLPALQPMPPTESGEVPRLVTVNEKTIETLSRQLDEQKKRCGELEKERDRAKQILALNSTDEENRMRQELSTLRQSHGGLVRGLQWALRNLHITFVKGGPQEDVKEFKDAQQALTNARNLKG